MMGWSGKIIGAAFGFLLGGPLGALLGVALGHNVDKQSVEGRGPRPRPRTGTRENTAFYTATFALMGHICKADGRVSDAEIALARKVMARMDLSEDQKNTAIRLFNEGKRPDFPLDAILWQVRQEAGNRHSLLRMFIEIQLAAAFADGEISSREQQLLVYVCDRLGISRFEYHRLEAMARAETRSTDDARAGAGPGYGLEDSYAVLDVPPGATDEQVKRAYRRLLSQHHPDKLVSKGLPEEMVKIATQKTREIRGAYERIRDARGF